MKIVISLLFSVFFSISIHAQNSSRALLEGKNLFATYCANCHGNAAQGATKAGFDISIITERGGKQPPNLTDDTWDYGSTDSDIFKVIKEGKTANMMPSFQGSFTDSQIRNVIAYVRSIGVNQDVSKIISQETSNPTGSNNGLTLELTDYLELPMTGDKSNDRVSGVMARGGILRDEPGNNQRAFINDLTGPLYIYDKKSKQLSTYLNLDGSAGHNGLFPKFTAAMGYAAGLVNFVFDPEYSKNGIFYTLHMENAISSGETAVPKSNVVPGLNVDGYTTTAALLPPIVPNSRGVREMVIVEWTDKQIGNSTFEGTAREVLRLQLPGIFHPLNEMIFNPTAKKGDPEWRVMYLGVGDAGTGERPGPTRYYAQRLDNYQGKILRIIPMMSEHRATSTISENGRYRIPNDNPFLSLPGAKKEIWAYGMRNPHRLTWYVDPKKPTRPTLLAFNIGLVTYETIDIIKKGANFGYPLREGSRSMSENNAMGPLPAEDILPIMISDSVSQGSIKPSYPVAQYPHAPGGGDAIANGFIYKGKLLPKLKDCLIFGDITTGRVWYSNIKEILLADDNNPLTVAPIYELNTDIRKLSEDTYKKRGGLSSVLPGRGAVAGAGRVDLRIAEDSEGELYFLTKGDGMIRKVTRIK
ncbi:c-type cytochrome [Aquirufa ecclesiirivi]|uniref:PQQ-dependent sugar dehydrogenase n=1 Tax=Aquirufa ecclesiirivi TaxID=2715124 RepID=UPI0022A85D4C|nr:PQQ-dependent sugar dehydrogenase [Aquirufa ecclesiirivi]MCZ2473175.1 c-type cytochrome [Aquirufa ecclesiirivi]